MLKEPDMNNIMTENETDQFLKRQLRVQKLCYCPELVPLNDNGLVHCTPGEPLPLEECSECPLLIREDELPPRLRKRREQAAQMAATRKQNAEARAQDLDDPDNTEDENDEDEDDDEDDVLGNRPGNRDVDPDMFTDIDD